MRFLCFMNTPNILGAVSEIARTTSTMFPHNINNIYTGSLSECIHNQHIVVHEQVFVSQLYFYLLSNRIIFLNAHCWLQVYTSEQNHKLFFYYAAY